MAGHEFVVSRENYHPYTVTAQVTQRVGGILQCRIAKGEETGKHQIRFVSHPIGIALGDGPVGHG
jgi:hypothetical protein